MSIKKALGTRIRNLRKSQKISQEKFSEMVGMTPRQIVRIEQGESFPTAENLEHIASSLSVSPRDLFNIEFENSDTYFRCKIKKFVDDFNSEKLKIVYNIVKNLSYL